VPGSPLARYGARVYTQPEDLAEQTLVTALLAGWGFAAAALRYQAVGFGSHHWLATDRDGGRLFVTVDDLAAKLSSEADSTDAAADRLERAFRAALSLRHECSLRFVVAPIPDRDGDPLVRLQDRYTMVVHPYLQGEQAGATSAFAERADLHELISLLVQLHGARPRSQPLTDDFAVPLRAELTAAMGQTSQAWQSGPYAERALFKDEHEDTADAAESWRNLQHFLQPVARWPGVFAGPNPAREPGDALTR
jgi:hypothetical protein